MIYIVIMYFTIALAFIVAKVALQYGAPFFTVAFRTLSAGTAFLLYQAISDRKNFYLKRKDLSLFLVSTIFYVYLVFVPEFWALQKLSAAKVTLIYTLTPFVVAILAYFLINAKFTAKKIIGLLIGLSGMIVVFLTKDASNHGGGEIFYVSLRESALLISVCSYGYGWFLIKRLKQRGYTLAMINGVTMFSGGIAMAITSLLYEGPFPVNNVIQFLLWTTLLTILANGIFYVMYGLLLRRYSFTFLSFAGFLSPSFSILISWLVLKENISIHHIISLGLIFIGLYIFYQEESKPKAPLDKVVKEKGPMV